ncbi:hypothetical protein QN366_01655 [Pseudomonas sp. CCC3.2]|uniref:hypothetical protein n=1 Tax=unclassified Pseudomonas TaxID=196821 RepID=UPI002AB34961|nr:MULTISPECIES: hypothetical protein [unclassified Pseudomonas]MDY7560227.1 hypothetical protein [Pseudomonas sp. AB6]MEB0178776.1 hypothetical protein [Pseudomonas sp. CCC3.2]MEB0211414.1 hypothetical protein [Pseudomonas sp. AB6]
MKRDTQTGKGSVQGLIAIVVALTIYAFFHHGSEADQVVIDEPANQYQFESIRSGKSDEYKNAKNELIQNKIFNDANEQQSSFWKSFGFKIDGWHGKVVRIMASSSGDFVSIELESTKGVTYKQDNIPSTSVIFKEVANFKEGDPVYFSGEFSKILKGLGGPLYQEGSVSKYGSLYGPTYGIHLSQMYEPNSKSPPVAAMYSPVASSDSDAFDQSNLITDPSTKIKSTSTKSDIEKRALSGKWACTDRLVTAEINDSIRHYPDYAFKLSLENECIDILDKKQASSIVVVGHESFVVPAGQQQEALLEIHVKAEDGSDYILSGYFHIMETDLTSYKAS